MTAVTKTQDIFSFIHQEIFLQGCKKKKKKKKRKEEVETTDTVHFAQEQSCSVKRRWQPDQQDKAVVSNMF